MMKKFLQGTTDEVNKQLEELAKTYKVIDIKKWQSVFANSNNTIIVNYIKWFFLKPIYFT